MTIIGKDTRGFWRAADDVAINTAHVVRIETFRNYNRELRTTATLFKRTADGSPTMISSREYFRTIAVSTPKAVSSKTCLAQHSTATVRIPEIIAEAKAAIERGAV